MAKASPTYRRSTKLCSIVVCTSALIGLMALMGAERTKQALTQRPTTPAAATGITGDWAQWGGSPARNNTPVGKNIPTEWEVGGFDRVSGAWQKDEAVNIKWVAPVGSQTYGNPVSANGKIYVGTNNASGYLKRFPGEVDLGCLVAFDAKDGSFLWQHSSEKLPTGRVHDWPLQGICCAPLVEGNRVWFVTSRGEVACLDTEGYRDGVDDGPNKAGWGRIFKTSPSVTAALDTNKLGDTVVAMLEEKGVSLEGRVRVKAIEKGSRWLLTIKDRKRETTAYLLDAADGKLIVVEWSVEDEKAGKQILSTRTDIAEALDSGEVPASLTALMASRGEMITGSPTIKKEGRKWSFTGQVNGKNRQFEIRREGPNLGGHKLITIDDQHEADEIWMYDMMAGQKVSQHNMCSCSVTSWGDILFVNTSNGVDESHINIPSPDAPSFIAMDKNTGKVLWSDKSPGRNILHGQWSSPAVGELGGVAQVIFGGGDGWVYSFAASEGKNGQPELLWKFDANPKTSEWILGGRGTRNNIIATPVLHNDVVYVAVGQDPEHGEGVGHLWCIDPTKRGDVSAELAVHVNDRKKVIPHRRLVAVDEKAGEVAIDNPNSAVIWHYSQFDQDGNGEFDFEETMHRSCGTVAIKNNILFIADFSGLFHCLNAKTGKVHWTYDMLAAAWGSPLIVEDKVYIGDEDGEVSVFKLSTEAHDPIAEINMLNSVYSTPIVSHNVLYISNKTHLFAIEAKGQN